MAVGNLDDTGWQRLLSRIGDSRMLATLALVALCALAYLPGFLLLPLVDRTEVVFAQSSRDMLAEGRLIDPRYLGERERHRPIGTFWLQIASAKTAAATLGEQAVARMQPYRLPSLLSVSLAVLLTYWLLAPLIGGRTALIGAGLFAVTPIAALQSQLAIAEGVALAPAIAAQLALLRIRCASDGASTRGLALLFWAAQGIGITINALAVPLVAIATLVALLAMERRAGWLHRLHAAWGIPVMLLLGSPWIAALVAAEGGMPFADLTFGELLRVLGGSQAMKFKAWPLTFTLAFIIGLLPCVLLLPGALRRLWSERASDTIARFLLAWIIGYLAYLELISSKPALYTVQVLLPAATVAVALLLARDRDAAPLRLPETKMLWPALAFIVAIPALYFAADRFAGGSSPTQSALLAAVPAVPLAIAARAASLRAAAAWTAMTLLGFALFLGTTLGLLMPRLEKGWTTEVIASAVGPLVYCASAQGNATPVAVIGYREPSTVFTFGPANVHLNDTTWQPRPGVAVVDERLAASVRAKAGAAGLGVAQVACLEAVNVTRGCAVRFEALRFGPSGGACPVPPRFACPLKTSGSAKPCT